MSVQGDLIRETWRVELLSSPYGIYKCMYLLGNLTWLLVLHSNANSGKAEYAQSIEQHQDTHSRRVALYLYEDYREPQIAMLQVN